jgi:GPI mannosyltransferase 3
MLERVDIDRVTRLLCLGPRGQPREEPRWRGIHLVAALALGLRLPLAVATDHINQPDEIFQYLEQAHRVVMGYGYVPWEYRFGTRSWVLPGLLSAWLYGLHALHVDDPDVYVPLTKALCCLLSLSLVYSGYTIGRSLASEAAGRLSAVFVAGWYELAYFAQKATPEVLGCYCLVGALGCVLGSPRARSPWLAGLLCGLAVALRLQYLPAVGILALPILFSRGRRGVLVWSLALLGVVAVAGLVDELTWGSFFASFYNNYLFNQVYHVSEIFGVSPLHYYPAAIARCSLGVLCVVPLLGLGRPSASWLLLACAGSVIVAHSLIPHKEYRFVFAAVAILLILTAVVFSEHVAARVGRSRRPLAYGIAAAALIGVSGAGLMGKLPGEQGIYRGDLLGRRSVLEAYRFLHHEEGLAAILNTYEHWYGIGGYYYLNRDVPVFFERDVEREHVELTRIVSHVVCPSSSPEIPGFRVIATFGDLEIRKQTLPPSRPLWPNVEAVNVLQEGIDDRYRSNVKRAY